jgi:hypothetical protein
VRHDGRPHPREGEARPRRLGAPRVDGALLRVEVIGEDAERFTVWLPSPTLTGAMTAMLLRVDVLPAGGAS